MTVEVFFVLERSVLLADSAFKWWIVFLAMRATKIALVELLILGFWESLT